MEIERGNRAWKFASPHPPHKINPAINRLERQVAAETNPQYGDNHNNNDNNGSRRHFTFLVSGLGDLSA